MTVVSLVSCSGAPGVTTLAVATAAALTTTEVSEPVLIELASSGGVVASQYDLPAEPGLTSLAIDLGGEPPDILAHAQELPGGLPVVVAPPSGSKTGKLLDARARPLAHYLRAAPATVMADCGRISSATPLAPLLERSSLVGVVVRPSRENFHLAASIVAELADATGSALPAGWVLVGPNPWSHEEIVGLYGLPILASIADDRVGAEAIAGLRRLRRHAPLARSAQSFADDIAKHLRVASADAPFDYLDPARSRPDELEAEEYEPDAFESHEPESTVSESTVSEAEEYEPDGYESHELESTAFESDASDEGVPAQ